MKKILLVDDDALVLELYRKKLVSGGFEVRTATDGMEAIKALTICTPDFAVVDLMMPKLSGVDVIKFMRSKPALAKTPVAVLTNAFMSDQARAVNSLGVTHAVVKGDCTPAKMLEIARQACGESTAADSALTDTAIARDETRENFLKSAAADFTDMHTASIEFSQDPAASSRTGILAELCRHVHHMAGAAASARCHHVAQMSGALEALLYELVEKSQFINPSTSRTVSSSVEFLGMLVENARNGRRAEPLNAEVLVVDDDPLANRIALAALTRARVNGRSCENPVAALELAAKQKFDLVLLDVEMPQMTGFDVCRNLRQISGYENTPVIYVTSHGDFESRAKSILVGANDLIAKPIFPIELAVKVVLHLIRHRLATGGAVATSAP
jgi:CheY-like chemotaxis protein